MSGGRPFDRSQMPRGQHCFRSLALAHSVSRYLALSRHRSRHYPGHVVCEDRIGTGPPRARTEVIYVDLGDWTISGSIHPKVFRWCLESDRLLPTRTVTFTKGGAQHLTAMVSKGGWQHLMGS